MQPTDLIVGLVGKPTKGLGVASKLDDQATDARDVRDQLKRIMIDVERLLREAQALLEQTRKRH
jgi:hypothetical protein